MYYKKKLWNQNTSEWALCSGHDLVLCIKTKLLCNFIINKVPICDTLCNSESYLYHICLVTILNKISFRTLYFSNLYHGKFL